VIRKNIHNLSKKKKYMEKNQLTEDLEALKMSPKDQTNKPPAVKESEPEIVEAIEGIDNNLGKKTKKKVY
jgi:hypothetical protein